MNGSDELRRLFLAGVGAMAATAEKSKEIIDSLVQKGELTVEQGKIINEELKRDVKKTVEQVGETVKKRVETVKEKVMPEPANPSDLIGRLDELSESELSLLRKKLSEMENGKDGGSGA